MKKLVFVRNFCRGYRDEVVGLVVMFFRIKS